MVKKYASGKDEPEQKSFELPSEKEHLFLVVDVYDIENNEHGLDLGPDDVSVKCEVVGGEEEGRSLLVRLSLDDKWKGFFASRLFLKVIGEQYKGYAQCKRCRAWKLYEQYHTPTGYKSKFIINVEPPKEGGER